MTSPDSPAAHSDALVDAVERTRKSYDQTPYSSTPHIRLHPGRMAANARWMGLAGPDAATGRVLEIGCASGGHILPLAAAMPAARFLGVDLSPVQIEAGRKRLASLGLTNIELRAQSFEEIGAADGVFEFIICHGVYSWIPEPLRDALLRVIRERLTPEGVAMVSFNVLPGWRVFQVARDAMMLNARFLADPTTRAERTRELFGLLAEKSLDKYTYGQFWRHEAKRMAAGGDAYLAHEIFEEDNAPETFIGFTDRIVRHELIYLSECALAANNEDSMVPEGAASIRALARGDELAREQYIDIFSGRAFREALIVRSARADAIRLAPSLESLESFHFIPGIDLEIRPAPDAEDHFIVADDGGGVTIRGAAVAESIGRLIARLPRSSRIEDLAAEDDEGRLRANVLKALTALVVYGHCAVSTLPVECAVTLAERPKAWRVAANDARDSDTTASLRHASVRLEPLQRLFLPMLDGTRTRDDLVAHAIELAERDVLHLNGPEGRITGREALASRLGPATDRCLACLLRIGLLVEG